jgi:hypothetical protein
MYLKFFRVGTKSTVDVLKLAAEACMPLIKAKLDIFQFEYLPSKFKN